MKGAEPRKRRTREHVIADLSVNHVERFIIDEGHTAQRVDPDYGYDLSLVTYDADGYVEPGLIYLQLEGLRERVGGWRDLWRRMRPARPGTLGLPSSGAAGK